MKLSSRSDSYIIPEYSLTGDLLSFLTCNLQYRFLNKGTLPPSKPIQLWFGEFIHGVMEEAYLKWEIKKTSFPWDWKKDIRPIEEMIDLRLRARGLYPPTDLFCPFRKDSSSEEYEYIEIGKCGDNNHPHKLLASARAESAINVWGPDLFPLIDSAEVLIKGNRNMPNFKENCSRSNYYGINGVIDVISSMNINNSSSNELLKYLSENKEITDLFENQEVKDVSKNQEVKDISENQKIKDLFENQNNTNNLDTIDCEEYEIIIDYKGMKRPSIDSSNWKRHKWQILTYAWLRSLQAESKPVAAGIIFYLNELVPSTEDLIAIKNDIILDNSDIDLESKDKKALSEWDENEDDYLQLSDLSKKNRSIRIIPIKEKSISKALNEFDKVVSNIEKSIISEINGELIQNAWQANADKRTCDACDFKYFCHKQNLKDLKIP